MKANILVVDDEKEIADLVGVYLQNEGFSVRTFETSGEALACLAAEKTDLAVLDVMLPDMDGFALLKTIREDHTFPVIMLTAKVEDVDKLTRLAIGADDYITKPFNPLELVARIKAQLRRMIVYIAVIIVLCVRTILKAVRYVDMIGGSIGTMMDMDTAVPDFPPDLRDVEISLNNIRFEMTRKEQLAREAEQRKNDLVTYLAHDLKTPLTSVIGYLTLLQEAPELPIAQRAKYTAVSLDKAYRLEQLINEFFDITRFNLQSVTLERNRIDFSLMIRQMVDEFYPILAEKGLTVQAGIEIVGDAGKLERVLDNLLRNAVNYSYPDTCVEVAAKHGGAYVSLSIKNKGDEIPADRLARIFEKFFRSDAARSTRTGGAGLGLAIAKQIVELHGGTISAISNREFTEFTIALPI